jgi:hypothetical protein
MLREGTNAAVFLSVGVECYESWASDDGVEPHYRLVYVSDVNMDKNVCVFAKSTIFYCDQWSTYESRICPCVTIPTAKPPTTLEVQMKVGMPYTKDSFDADVQNKFLSAVASSVETPVDNLYIKSVVEKTSSRRVFRKLLAVSVEVDFAISVQDAAAQAAMMANDGLTEAKLNIELVKQVSPVSAYFGRERRFALLAADCAAR